MKYDILVQIGRFQPWHLGHHAQLLHGLDMADRIVIALGSSDQLYPSDRNPWSSSERQEMISANLPAHRAGDVSFVRLWDMPGRDQDWAQQVRDAVSQTLRFHPTTVSPRIGLLGYKKDASSFYLDLFPEWPLESGPFVGLSATDIRKAYFDPKSDPSSWVGLIPPGTKAFLDQFKTTERYIVMSGGMMP